MSFDETYAGFGSAPKFPSPHNLSFLLRWWKRSSDEEALAMVEKTLDAMSRGGMVDHVGFGFHRYSTDARWLVPHFEKMLYDQAMLAMAYAEAFQATGKHRYADVLEQTFTYVLRDMTSPEGAFYSSEDADSEGEEGKFYTWTWDEIQFILGEKQGDLFCRFYGVTKQGNFDGGTNILHTNKSLREFAEEESINTYQLENLLEEARRKLLAVGEKRVRPLKNNAVLTDWNGLMIAALSKGSQALNKPEYSDAARHAADFILDKMRNSEGRLLHRYREGEAAVPGYIDDYALLAWGLIELYESTFEARYLKEALDLTEEMLRLFWDKDKGGFYFTGIDSEKLITRTKEIYDGAVPSGNSVAALNLFRLGRMAMRRDFEEKGEQLLESFSGVVSRTPAGFAQLLLALDFALGPTREIIIAGELGEKTTQEMLRAVWHRFLPRKVLVLNPPNGSSPRIDEIVPFLKDRSQINGRAAAYVCENYTCRLPTTDVSKMISYIEQK